jgi:hypothetical protein
LRRLYDGLVESLHRRCFYDEICDPKIIDIIEMPEEDARILINANFGGTCGIRGRFIPAHREFPDLTPCRSRTFRTRDCFLNSARRDSITSYALLRSDLEKCIGSNVITLESFQMAKELNHPVSTLLI